MMFIAPFRFERRLRAPFVRAPLWPQLLASVGELRPRAVSFSSSGCAPSVATSAGYFFVASVSVRYSRPWLSSSLAGACALAAMTIQTPLGWSCACFGKGFPMSSLWQRPPSRAAQSCRAFSAPYGQAARLSQNFFELYLMS